MSINDWLPPPADISLWEEDIETLIEQLYLIYEGDFIHNPPSFRNAPVQRKKYPLTDGKDTTFWHIITQGQEPNRKAIPERCQCLPWIKPVILNESTNDVKVWPVKRGQETRYNLFLEEKNFLVVLAQRKEYFIIWTAYPVYKHTKKKLLKQFSEYKTTEVAP